MDTDFNQEQVVVVGLGYVGLTLAAHLARIGFNVHGVEIRKEVTNLLEQKKSFFWEPNLDTLLEKVIFEKKFTFSADIPSTFENRIFIITVGTPLDLNKNSNMEPISRAARQVGQAMQTGDMVLLRSTVMVGTTQGTVEAILSEYNKDFDLAFCPERTLEGAALAELSILPQIIGADSERSTIRASQFYQKVTNTVITVSDSRTAETIKLVDNMQRDAHFAISNEVARLSCLLGVKASEVIATGKIGYSRTNLALPGPVGGPCLEKDSYILTESAGEQSSSTSVTLLARKTNELVTEVAVDFVLKYLSETFKNQKLKISVLGFAFKGKPETSDLRGSPVLNVLDVLKNSFLEIKLHGWDPIVSKEDISSCSVEHLESLSEAFEGSHAVILVNNHSTLDILDIDSLSSQMVPGGVIYDFWDRYSDWRPDDESVLYFGWGNHKISKKHKPMDV